MLSETSQSNVSLFHLSFMLTISFKLIRSGYFGDNFIILEHHAKLDN